MFQKLGKVFKIYVEDPSNKNDKFKRIKVRNLIRTLKSEGLDKRFVEHILKNWDPNEDQMEIAKTLLILGSPDPFFTFAASFN